VSTIAISVALVAALCFALTAALQHWAASREPTHKAMDPRLLLRLLRRPLWLVGEVAHVAGTGLQALALALGALAVVEPVLASALFLAIPLEAAITRRRPRRRDLTAVALATCGLSVFLFAAKPASGISMPSGTAWAWTAAVFIPMIACCFALARRWTGARRATCLGLASGAMNGVCAALLKTCADRLTADPMALLLDWRPYALLVVGIAALLLNQNAFQGCSLAAPLTALTLSEPIVGLAIGVTAFQENLSAGGLHAVILVVAAIAMVRGVWLASSAQPVFPGARACAEGRQSGMIGESVHAAGRQLGAGSEPVGAAAVTDALRGAA
jgi:drug/metabolite transporter (DMT)-like permease